MTNTQVACDQPTTLNVCSVSLKQEYDRSHPTIHHEHQHQHQAPEERSMSSDDGEDEAYSSDEALMEMLGLSTLDVQDAKEDDEDEEEGLDDNIEKIHAILASQRSHKQYTDNGFCLFPSALSVSSARMRRLTDELVWGGDAVKSDKSYENIQVIVKGGEEVLERRTLTRLENFVSYHDGWKELNQYVTKCISALLGKEMVLFKEKLNLKPPGGTGFAPHLDGPSLRVALGGEGPKTFVTVMIAIDNMTSQNGCLRIYPGEWSEDNTCQVIPPEKDGNPDSGGRAGAIPTEIADTMNFVDLTCDCGSIAAFSEWAPHRSSANVSPFPRRAVFLTYNPAEEGDFHAMYYQRMEEKRDHWRSKIGLTQRKQVEEDQRLELEALSTVPK